MFDRRLVAWAAPLFVLGVARLVAACPSAAADLRDRLAAPAPSADAGPAPCMKFWGEARSTGYGYKHVVVLSSGCKKPQSCEVSTDVTPEVTPVVVEPGETKEVVTFLESPASTFTPRVLCR